MSVVLSYVRSIDCLRIAVGILSAVLMPSLALGQPATGTRVLVMPFAAEVEPGAGGGTGAALWLGEAAAVLVEEGLSSQGVGAMMRDERVAAFAELNVPMTPALTRATMIRIGELMGASDIVFGDVRLDDRLRVRARLVRLSSGQEVPAVESQGELADIFQVFAQTAAQLAVHTGRPLAEQSPLPPLALETFESYLKGLVATTPVAQQRFLESAVRDAPADPRILMALWAVHSAQGEHARALASANAVPADAVDYGKARFAVALSLIELQRLDGAWEVLGSLYESHPSAAISSALGVVQLRRGAAAGGHTPTVYFARAVAEDPENSDYLFNLGYAYARERNAADALTWLREAVRFDAADGDAHQLMSVLLATAGRTPEAQRELDLARLLGGTEHVLAPVLSTVVPEGRERLPSLLTWAAPSTGRVTVANPAQRDQHETARFHLANGQALLEARRDREAIEELRRAIYLAPYEDEPHLLLGRIYQRAGRFPEAIDQFTVALWCRETATGRAALGSVLLDSGQVEAARREAERALALDRQSVEALALIQRLGG